MNYLGGYQLGRTVPLYLQCKQPGNIMAVPDSPPQMKVFSGSTLIEQHLMPITDRYILNGLFRYTLFLGRLYATGYYQVVYYYEISGTPYADTETFQVIDNGSVIGAVNSTYFYDRPEAQYIVQGTETGEILKGRNPTT